MQSGNRDMACAGAQSGQARPSIAAWRRNGLQSLADGGKYHARPGQESAPPAAERAPRLGGAEGFPSAEAFAYFAQNGRSGIARDNGNGDGPRPPASFHFFAADDLVAGPIATFHQRCPGKEAGDPLRAEVKAIENHDPRRRTPKQREFSARFAFWDDRAGLSPFKLANTRITV